ncbi:MAG: hypothetical protein AAGE59_16270 [Cyanobacteria bacterium P01_F01_bin.86]
MKINTKQSKETEKNALLSTLSLIEQEKVRGGSGCDRTMFDTIMKCDIDIRSTSYMGGGEEVQALVVDNGG